MSNNTANDLMYAQLKVYLINIIDLYKQKVTDCV